MGKITNVILNSIDGTATSSNNANNLNYYIDWSSILKNNQKYKLTFNFMGSYNYINSFRFPFITVNIPMDNYTIKNNTSYNLGNLKFIMSNPTSYSGNFESSVIDNPPSYLENRPMNNILNITILDNITKTEFFDESITDAGTGTATQAGNILTIVSLTTGVIYIGTVITISSINRTVIGFITGTGGVGKYQVDLSATVSTATAFTFPSNQIGGPISPYILTLSFEEVE